MAAVEAVALTFAGISAAKDAIDLWRMHRNVRQVRETLQKASAGYSPEQFRAAQSIINNGRGFEYDDLIDIFTGRVGKCYAQLRKIIDKDDLPPDVVDGAFRKYRECVCMELNRVKSLSPLPPDWQSKWDDFDCEYRNLPHF